MGDVCPLGWKQEAWQQGTLPPLLVCTASLPRGMWAMLFPPFHCAMNNSFCSSEICLTTEESNVKAQSGVQSRGAFHATVSPCFVPENQPADLQSMVGQPCASAGNEGKTRYPWPLPPGSAVLPSAKLFFPAWRRPDFPPLWLELHICTKEQSAIDRLRIKRAEGLRDLVSFTLPVLLCLALKQPECGGKPRVEQAVHMGNWSSGASEEPGARGRQTNRNPKGHLSGLIFHKCTITNQFDMGQRNCLWHPFLMTSVNR